MLSDKRLVPQTRMISAVLMFLLAMPCLPLRAMTPQPAAVTQLKIVILEGEGAINNIRQRTAREPIVQVEDENRKPVAGALILFVSPERGPGVVFADGSKSLMVYTDSKGQAVARGLRPNQSAGKFQLKVTASFQGVSTGTVLNQVNVVPKVAAVGSTGKVLAIIGAAGAAAAAGIVMATRKKDISPSPAPSATTITVGTPVVGRP